jgi:hypothetical protein
MRALGQLGEEKGVTTAEAWLTGWPTTDGHIANSQGLAATGRKRQSNQTDLGPDGKQKAGVVQHSGF